MENLNRQGRCSQNIASNVWPVSELAAKRAEFALPKIEIIREQTTSGYRKPAQLAYRRLAAVLNIVS